MITELPAEPENTWGLMRGKIEDEFLGEILDRVWQEYADDLLDCIGSTRYHHNYEGGLMAHIWSVFNISLCIKDTYPELDNDLMGTSAMLHDLGKIMVYKEAPKLKNGKDPKWKYMRNEESKTMDHIGESLLMVKEIVMGMEYDGVKIDPQKFRKVLHIIASHHSDVRRGWGSLVNPNSPEAHVVSEADYISSRLGVDVPDE